MKPQLITQDTAGKHFKDPNTRARLLQGASWKKQRIVVILPADAVMGAKVALSHWNLMFPPNNGVFRILAQGMEVGEAYSSALEQVLAHPELSKWEYVLTLEHDNMPPSDGILRLLARMEANKHLDCISGLYFTKGEGGVAQIWGEIADPIINFRPQVPIPGELMECHGTGMGFALWRMRIFKDGKLPKPLFETKKGREGIGTQDLQFWANARKLGYRCAVDCAVPVGHYDVENDMVW